MWNINENKFPKQQTQQHNSRNGNIREKSGVNWKNLMCGAQVCVEVLAGGKTQWRFALQVHCVFVTDEKQRSDIELEVPQRCLAVLMRAAVEAHKLMDCSPAPGGSSWEGLSNGGGSWEG